MINTCSPPDLEIVGYHESSEEWKQIVEIDGKWSHLMKVTAHEPETLKVRILPVFLKDGKVDIKITRKTGDYAAIAKLGLYQYEEEEIGPSKSGGAQSASKEGMAISGIEFMLMQNAPNPFTERTAISYQLPKAGPVNLGIYNITGQLVKNIVEESQSAGLHEVFWDGKDGTGRVVSGGIYFYRLKTIGSEATKRLILIK